jgi:uncharacterized protein (TIGR04255 family)
MKNAPSHSLPKFDKPPVVEMVIGVEFSELPNWSIPHFGLFWGQIRNEYQHCSVNPPLNSQIEVFSAPGRQELSLKFPIIGPPEVRCWYFDKTQTWLIQVQRDRFVHNWRKTSQDAEYSRFYKIRERFEKEWRRFCNFVKSENIGDLQIRQCEVTYFNHIDRQDSQEAMYDLSEIFPCWSNKLSGDFLPEPEVVSLRASYVIPENRGRLHITAQPVFRHADAKEIIQLQVTAKVIPSSPDFADALKAIDLGHQWAVNGFADFTSAKMHDQWERRQ